MTRVTSGDGKVSCKLPLTLTKNGEQWTSFADNVVSGNLSYRKLDGVVSVRAYMRCTVQSVNVLGTLQTRTTSEVRVVAPPLPKLMGVHTQHADEEVSFAQSVNTQNIRKRIVLDAEHGREHQDTSHVRRVE